ncbi:MAG: response regulator transcription factor [Treponema sp.]|nr:response regulator transcription factor [Treponema sp.]
MQSKLKILFIDDHNGLREGMIFLLKNKNPSFEISGVSNVEEGIELLSKDKDFSLVILDLNLDGENSLETIPAIKKADPKVSILVYTMYNSEHQVANAQVNFYNFQHKVRAILIRFEPKVRAVIIISYHKNSLVYEVYARSLKTIPCVTQKF